VVQAVLAPVSDADKRLQAIAEAMAEEEAPVVRTKVESAEAAVGTDPEEQARSLDQDAEVAELKKEADAIGEAEEQKV